MISASTVMCPLGVTLYLRISAARPSSMAPRMMPSHISVCWARRTRGLRNSGTALAIASTPVSAEQPDANAFRISSTPTASVALGRLCAGATTGWDRISPPMMTTAIDTMKGTVGRMNSRAESATPQKFAAVIRASAPRHSQTRAPYRAGKAEVSASIPAETPTAALRM